MAVPFHTWSSDAVPVALPVTALADDGDTLTDARLGPKTESVAVAEEPCILAVIVAVCVVAVWPVQTVNVALVCPAGTVTGDTGLAMPLLLVTVTATPLLP